MHMTFRSPLRSLRQVLLVLAGALTLAVGALAAARCAASVGGVAAV